MLIFCKEHKVLFGQAMGKSTIVEPHQFFGTDFMGKEVPRWSYGMYTRKTES